MSPEEQLTEWKNELSLLLRNRHIEAATNLVAQAFELAGQTGIPVHRAAALEMEALLQNIQNNYPAALATCDKAMAIYKKHQHAAGQAQVLVLKAGVYYAKSEFRFSVSLCERALTLAAGQPLIEANAHKTLGIALAHTGQHALGIQHLQKALGLYTRQKNQIQKAATHLNLAIAHRYMADYTKATEAGLKAIRLFEQNSQPLNAAVALDLLGAVFNDRCLPQKALTYLHRAQKIRLQHNDLRGLFFSYINEGSAYFILQQYTRCLQATHRAKALITEPPRPSELCRIHVCYAAVYIETEQWDEAEQHCRQALEYLPTCHDARTQAEVSSTFGNLCYRTSRLPEAQKWLEESAALGREKEIWPHVAKCEELLYEIAEKQGKAANALHHYRQLMALRKQQLDLQIQQRMLLLQMQFDTEQKDAELERLRTERDTLTHQRQQNITEYKLTNRETDILQLLVQGLSYKLIAAELGIAYETTRGHIVNLYKKLNVGTNTEAVAKAIKEGLV